MIFTGIKYKFKAIQEIIQEKANKKGIAVSGFLLAAILFAVLIIAIVFILAKNYKSGSELVTNLPTAP